MFKLLNLTFIVTFFAPIAFANYSSSQSDSKPLLFNEIGTTSKKESKYVHYLEDFYWAYRNQNATWMKTSLQNFKPRSKELSPYKKVLQDGWKIYSTLSSQKSIECHKVSKGFDLISKKYYRLFKSICVQKRLFNILSSQSPLSSENKLFLLSNDYILTSKRYNNQLTQKIESSNLQDRTFFSNFIKNYIYNHKKLPNRDYLAFMSSDSKITQFIQKNALFDIYDNKYFTKEFKKLISIFKSTFLEGDQESATQALEQAVTFYNNNEDKIDNANAWKLFFYNGQKVARSEDSQDLALSLFKFSEKVAEEDNLYDSKFQSLITFYQANQLSRAISFINENKFIENFSEVTPQIRFWTAYIFDKTNEKVVAKGLYLKLISLNPLSYYSILSLKQLRDINPNYDSDVIIKSDSFKGIEHLSFTQKAARNIKLFRLFSSSGNSFLTSLQGSELRRTPAKQFFTNKFDQNSGTQKNFLLSFFSQEKEYLLSFKQAYSGLKRGDIQFTPTVISSLFPTIYGNIIRSQKSPIDHRLILSLIRQESAFNRKAKSVVGARGLMQLMPATARMFKRRLRTHQLFDPNLNINIGVKFLERLVKRYDGNLILTLSAYNAGMGNVSKWQKSIPFSKDILLNVELIPFSETRKYVKLIYRNLFFYKYLDQDPTHLDLALNDSFHVSFKQSN